MSTLFLFSSVMASVFFGIFLNVILNEYGLVVAIIAYVIAFALDLKSTLNVKDYARRETNQIFQLFSHMFGKYSFAVVFAISVSASIISYVILGDPIITYVAVVCHLCASVRNFRLAKEAVTCKI